LTGRSELGPTGGSDARRILVVRALRGFVDGLVSVLLAGYLTRLGFTPLEVGAIVTGTLLGSAALTVALGLVGYGLSRRLVLLGAAMLMLATGLGFAGFTDFWPLLVVAVLGTLNPSAGDVSVFLPTEQAALAEIALAQHRTRLFASYNVSGNFMGAFGALASGAPVVLARAYDLDLVRAERCGFLVYALVAVVSGILYLGLGPDVETRHVAPAHTGPLGESRKIVVQLAALFSLDSFGGGFAIQSLLVLWLHQRFQLSAEVTGAVFFAAGVLGGLSQLVSPILAARIGLVPTMVYTHLPANVFLIAAGLVPSAPLAIAFLLLRASLSQMDVPARQAYVMAVVPSRSRAAAASVTNVPRSLAAAVPPLFVGAMLSYSSIGWPLVCGGVLKALYDVLLLLRFRAVPGLDEG
jgi:MFS family permease